MTYVRSVMQVEHVEFNMSKQINHKGKLSHCTNKKPRDPEAIKLWLKKLEQKKRLD